MKSNSNRVVLKLDMKKAFDTVKLHFPEELLLYRGCSMRWIGRIQKITHEGRGYVGVKLNKSETGFYFLTRKRLRQDDPLSPLLFNLVVDVLTRRLIKVASEDLNYLRHVP